MYYVYYNVVGLLDSGGYESRLRNAPGLPQGGRRDDCEQPTVAAAGRYTGNTSGYVSYK